MSVPRTKRLSKPAPPAPAPATSGAPGPKINPATGLSTDYLNHFTEAVMALEMIDGMPDCLDDVRAWRPKTYVQHFAGSRFSNRDAVIAAYRKAEPALRKALERNFDALNATLTTACGFVLRHAGTPEASAMTRRALDRIAPLLDETANLINGQAAGTRPQATIDAMFAR